MTQFEEHCAMFAYVPKGRPLKVLEAAEILGKHPVTLDQWRVAGRGPRYFKPQGTNQVYYTEPDILAWLAGGERRSTSENAA